MIIANIDVGFSAIIGNGWISIPWRRSHNTIKVLQGINVSENQNAVADSFRCTPFTFRRVTEGKMQYEVLTFEGRRESPEGRGIVRKYH
jgi:hypothetical protein